MGNLKNLYKIFYKMYTEVGDEESGDKTITEFNGVPVKVRNKNKDGSYRYYEEDGSTVTIKKNMMGGVYLEYGLDQTPPFVIGYFITENEDVFKKVVKQEMDKTITELKKGLEETVLNGIEKLVKRNQRAMETLLDEKKEHRSGYAQVGGETPYIDENGNEINGIEKVVTTTT